jgi:hypothetical protein
MLNGIGQASATGILVCPEHRNDRCWDVWINSSAVVRDPVLENAELTPAVYAFEVSWGENRDEDAGMTDGLGQALRPRRTDRQLLDVTVSDFPAIASEIVMNRRNKVVEKLIQKVRCGSRDGARALAVATIGASVAEEKYEGHWHPGQAGGGGGYTVEASKPMTHQLERRVFARQGTRSGGG